MILKDALDQFTKKAPVSVMVRATIENVLADDHLDSIFENHAVEQRSGELMFSTVADIMGLVVSQVYPSVNAVYVDRKEEIGVTAKSVYDKLKGIEPNVSRSLLRETAERMRQIIDATGGVHKPLLDGYHTKILDGNHLRRTDRRIGELRDLNSAPLPGQALVIFDPRLRLVIDALPCEDGHAQERSLLGEILDTVAQDDLWIADRNFCTVGFLTTIANRGGKFIIRQHKKLPFKLIGPRKKVGEGETGPVYEQKIEVIDASGDAHLFRRLTVQLKEPTRDGDREINIVSNLPGKVRATRIATLYRDRWKIETAFQEVAESLEGEIKSLGYPKAALFAFSMALLTYNLLSVARSAVHAVHGEEAAADLSTYYMAHEVASIQLGMSIAIDEDCWRDRFSQLTPKQLAAELKRIAKHMRLDKYKKAKWKPKPKPKKKPPSKQHRQHVSTARVLSEARN